MPNLLKIFWNGNYKYPKNQMWWSSLNLGVIFIMKGSFILWHFPYKTINVWRRRPLMPQNKYIQYCIQKLGKCDLYIVQLYTYNIRAQSAIELWFMNTLVFKDIVSNEFYFYYIYSILLGLCLLHSSNVWRIVWLTKNI